MMLSIWWVLPSRITVRIAGVAKRTSQAGNRPPPTAGSSRWETIPSKLAANWVLICCCWSSGKTSTMRLTVWAAELVWRVAKTKCPVSAIVIAAAMVSKSRISPTKTTSGSSRSAERRAVFQERVSRYISRCSIRAFLLSKTYSIGSSIVMT